MKHLKDIKDWRELKNQVVCGDCLEGMNELPSWDALVDTGISEDFNVECSSWKGRNERQCNRAN